MTARDISVITPILQMKKPRFSLLKSLANHGTGIQAQVSVTRPYPFSAMLLKLAVIEEVSGPFQRTYGELCASWRWNSHGEHSS